MQINWLLHMAAFKRILPPGSARAFSPIPSGNRPADHTVEDLSPDWVRFAPGRGQFDCSRDDLFDCTTRDHLDQEVQEKRYWDILEQYIPGSHRPMFRCFLYGMIDKKTCVFPQTSVIFCEHSSAMSDKSRYLHRYYEPPHFVNHCHKLCCHWDIIRKLAAGQFQLPWTQTAKLLFTPTSPHNKPLRNRRT